MADLPAGTDIPAWIARIQTYVANPPNGINAADLVSFQVIEATAPAGLNVGSTAFSELIPLFEAFEAAMNPAGGQAGQGRRHRKSRRRRHGRKKTHRRS
jgi:hypothetical protein